MFLPAGLFRILQWWQRSSVRHNIAVLVGALITWTLGIIAGAAGVVLIVELLGRILSPDYHTTPDAAWPAIQLFGQEWLPGSVMTWVWPVLLVVIGVMITATMTRKWQAMNEE